jgi:S-adenosylmethionine synthetase
VQLAYAIGVVKPVAIRIDTFGTGKAPEAAISTAVAKLFDLSPLGIIKELSLRRPIYRQTAVYGHFGRTDIDLPWESTARAKELAEELS